MDEVKRQVAMAMQGRDQEVVSLRQKNKDLEQALVEANKAMRDLRVGEMQSNPTVRPEEILEIPARNPLGVGGGVGGRLGDPALSQLHASVPGGNLPGAGRGELHPSLGLAEPPGLGQAGRGEAWWWWCDNFCHRDLGIYGSGSRTWKRHGASSVARSGHEATSTGVYGQGRDKGLRAQGWH